MKTKTKKVEKLKVNWEDCAIEIKCPHCGMNIELDSQNDPITCKCGAIYFLSCIVYQEVEV